MRLTNKTRVFRFRAECEPDVHALVGLLDGRLVRLNVVRRTPFPDVVCDIELVGVCHEGIREICRQVVDGHVMVETIQPKELYTGEREYGL